MRYTWDATPTPIGLFVATFAGSRLVSAHLTDDNPQWEVERISAALRAPAIHWQGAASEVARQLDEYFAGARRQFDLDLDWRLAGTGFAADALKTICTIAYSETVTYGEVAVLAGRPRAARAVGTACRTSPFSLVVPVHRVIRADGTVGRYGSSPDVKRFLIEHERAITAGDVSKSTFV